MLFFRKWYTDGWEIWQKIGIEIVRFSRSGRHIHVRFLVKEPPPGLHFALFTHSALAYTLCILTKYSPTQHLTSLVSTQEDHHTLFMLSILCCMLYSFYSCFSSCLLACSLFIATRCTFQGFSSFEWRPELRIAQPKTFTAIVEYLKHHPAGNINMLQRYIQFYSVNFRYIF